MIPVIILGHQCTLQLLLLHFTYLIEDSVQLNFSGGGIVVLASSGQTDLLQILLVQLGDDDFSVLVLLESYLLACLIQNRYRLAGRIADTNRIYLDSLVARFLSGFLGAAG